MKRVVIIGSGNLAEALAQAVAASELELVQVFARNAARAEEVARLAASQWTTDPEQLAEADIYILSVSDKAIGLLASSLPIPTKAVVAHTGGSVPLDELPAKFPRRAVIYPLQTFTKGRRIDFSQIPILVEASDALLRAEIEALAGKLSGKVMAADSAHRAKLHLAGVFACNFANHMYAIGERIAQNGGFSFDILKPLIAETAAKAVAAASPADVQTGPAVRNDFTTKALHSDMLDFDLRLKNIYSTISQSIWETSKKI